MRKKRKLKQRKIINIILIILIIISLFSIIYYCYNLINWKKDVSDNNNIKETIENKITIIEPDSDITEEIIKYNIDFTSLKEKNPDTIAYIKVNNTEIDYIVVKGNNNDYYLNHNFNKKYNVAGWIFADYHNNFDEKDRNIIIYGHNTKDGSMFGTLKNILNKDWYLNEENRKVTLVTEKDTYYYEVFSTYVIVAEDYYITTDFENDDEFAKFVKKLKSRSIYDYKIEVSSEDRILTLSSCIGDGTKRVVLHAKLK